MSTTVAPLTVEAFLELPEPEGQRIELIQGEVITMGRGGYPHELVKSNIFGLLQIWQAQNPIGRVFVETMFRLDAHTSPIPDVSFVLNSRLVPGMKGHITGAPDLAVEVVSSETATQLERKVNLYLAHGSQAVWVAYPEHSIVRAYDATGLSRRLGLSDRLEAPELLPAFNAPIAAVFEGL